MRTPATDRRGKGGAGFTLIEVLVALVFLTLVATALGAASQQAARTLRRSRVELDAARVLEDESERLRYLSFDSLVGGTRTHGRGIATWTVADSGAFRQVLLVTRYGSPASGLAVDSVTLLRFP